MDREGGVISKIFRAPWDSFMSSWMTGSKSLGTASYSLINLSTPAKGQVSVYSPERGGMTRRDGPLTAYESPGCRGSSGAVVSSSFFLWSKKNEGVSLSGEITRAWVPGATSQQKQPRKLQTKDRVLWMRVETGQDTWQDRGSLTVSHRVLFLVAKRWSPGQREGTSWRSDLWQVSHVFQSPARVRGNQSPFISEPEKWECSGWKHLL